MKIDSLILLVFALAIVGIIATPIANVGRILATQKALNAECGTEYSFIDVALAGDNLSRICQIKGWTITIK
jgi:hypothetical protein